MPSKNNFKRPEEPRHEAIAAGSNVLLETDQEAPVRQTVDGCQETEETAPNYKNPVIYKAYIRAKMIKALKDSIKALSSDDSQK